MKISLPALLRIEDLTDIKVGRMQIRMHDYTQVGMNLRWQRRLMYVAALALAGYYYSSTVALVCFTLLIISETYDHILFNSVLAWTDRDRQKARVFYYHLVFSAILSTSAIMFYAIGVSHIQGTDPHFMPLFLLFAAAIFAAMNNHQMKSILNLRISSYVGAFIYIPLKDVVISGAPLRSDIWAQFFVSLFVLYFIIDCSRMFMKFYHARLRQIEMLRCEHEKAQEAYRAKTEFVATISHELRTPLTSIKGAVDILASGKADDKPDVGKNLVSLAQRNCNKLLSLVNEILDLQKAEGGQLEVNPRDIDLIPLLQETIASNETYASSFGVKLVPAFADREIRVEADPKRLSQVFANVLSNAAKFSPAGSKVRIEVNVEEEFARVSFVDEGSGLSRDDAEKVFDRFTQLDSSDTRKSGGTGLGMNISRYIMEHQGGLIDYHPNEDVGTTFFVEIPLSFTGAEDQPLLAAE